MALFSRVREDPKRRERLVTIKRSIESSFKFEEDAMSRPLNSSTLKRVYNIDSLWVAEGSDIKKMGSANYSRELSIFSELKDRYGEITSLTIQRGGMRYHVLERRRRTYAFSTPLELTSGDIAMIMNELEGRAFEKNVFVSCSVNLTQNDG